MSVNIFRSVVEKSEKWSAESDGKIRMRASAYCVDTKGLLVRQDGIDMSRFSRNPVLLWGHDHDMVIGRADNWGFDEVGLWFEPSFSSSQQAQEIKRDVQDNIVRACSIGGRILKCYWSWNTQDEKPDEFSMLTADEKSLLAAGKVMGIILKVELWEISLCAVGANPEALRLSASENLVALKQWAESLEFSPPLDTPSAKLERPALACGATKEREEQCMSLDDEIKRKQELSAKLDEEIQLKQSSRAKMEQDIEAKRGDYASLVAKTEELRLQALSNRWTIALAAGKTIPATKEVELALLATMNEKQVDAYFQILEARAPLFSTEKQSSAKVEDPHRLENGVDVDYMLKLDAQLQKVGAI